jgi:hypothetical protein
LLGEINTVHYDGQHITATDSIEGRSKSAILKGSTKYRDIDTGEFLETFEEGRNLELVSVKMPVLMTTGKNLFDGEIEEGQFDSNGNPSNYVGRTRSKNFIKVPKNTYLAFILIYPTPLFNLPKPFFSSTIVNTSPLLTVPTTLELKSAC